MPQLPRKIPIGTASYFPVDPNQYIPQSYSQDMRRDMEGATGVLAYDGYNFLPTANGYKSYFGLDAAIDQAVPDQVQEFLFLQLENLQNLAIALCEQGIWIKYPYQPWVLMAPDVGGTAIDPIEAAGLGFGDWDPTDISTLPIVDPNESNSEEPTYFQWTYALIENILYCYRAGSPYVWKINSKAEILPLRSLNYQDLVFEIHAATDDGTLSTGVYDVAISFGILSPSTSGGTEIKETDPAVLGSISLITAGDGIKLAATDLDITPVMINIYYQVDGGPDWNKVSYVLPGYDYFNIIWKHPAAAENQDVTFPPVPDPVPAGVPSPHEPTFLNMAGQLGIFRAGFQLAFWDSANAIACSSVNDPFDFVPSIETLASVTTYSQISGRVIAVIPEENNFVIYATKSITRCVYDVSEVQQWRPVSISKEAGIHSPKSVCVGNQQAIHFAYTNVGLLRINNGQIETIFPEVWDWLNSIPNNVVHLACVGGRYLFFSSGNAIYAPLSFVQSFVNPLLVRGGMDEGACGNLNAYAAIVREPGISFLGEMSLLNYYHSGRAGVFDMPILEEGQELAEDAQNIPAGDPSY